MCTCRHLLSYAHTSRSEAATGRQAPRRLSEPNEPDCAGRRARHPQSRKPHRRTRRHCRPWDGNHVRLGAGTPAGRRACQRVRWTPDRQVPMNTYPHAYTSALTRKSGGPPPRSSAREPTPPRTVPPYMPGCVQERRSARNQKDDTPGEWRSETHPYTPGATQDQPRAHKRTCTPDNEHVPDATPERSCSYTTKWAYTKTTAAGWGRAITYAWVQVRPRAGRACQRVRRTPDRQVPMNTYPHAYTSGTAWWSLALRQTGQGTAANTHPCVHDDPAERHQDDETASRGRPRMAITTRSNRDDGFEASCPRIRLDCSRSRTSRSESKPRGCAEGATISRRRDLQHPLLGGPQEGGPGSPLGRIIRNSR